MRAQVHLSDVDEDGPKQVVVESAAVEVRQQLGDVRTAADVAACGLSRSGFSGHVCVLVGVVDRASLPMSLDELLEHHLG
jgi:hypothetical protein